MRVLGLLSLATLVACSSSSIAGGGSGGQGGVGASGGGSGGSAGGGAGSGGTGGSGGGSANNAPTVDAGPGGNLQVDTTGVLAGSASDLDGDSLTFTWQQLSGPVVTLQSASSLATTFLANTGGAASLTFELEACDPQSACATDTVTFAVVTQPVWDTYVAPFGSDDTGTNDGTSLLPWLTLAQGLSVAAAEVALGNVATVHVAAGLYAESVTMIEGVSVHGGYDASVPSAWVRDVPNNPTIIASPDDRGVLYAQGGTYALPTSLDGLVLTNTAAGTSRAALTLEEGNAAVRDTEVRAPDDATTEAIGIAVDSVSAPVDLDLTDVRIEGGNVTDATGTVWGMRIASGGNGADVQADRLVIDLPMTDKRRHRGIEASDATLTLVDATISIASAAEGGLALADDDAIGILGERASVDLTRGSVDPGGGFHSMRGVQVFDGSTLTLTDAVIQGGDARGPDDATTSSHAVFLEGSAAGSTVTIDGGSITGGQVDQGTTVAHRSFGLYAQAGSLVTVNDADINAGPGDWGIGVRFLDTLSGHVVDSRINTGGNGTACQNARQCHGVFIERGQNPPAQQISPVAPEYSCCDPTHWQIAIEGSEIVGGVAPEANALWAGGSPNPSFCVNASHLDAGACAAGLAATAECRGIRLVTQMPFMLHNNVVYGGVSSNAMALQLLAGNPEASIANNYFHGGDASGNTSFTYGFFIGIGVGAAGADGMRVLNNIFHSGTGQERFAVYEENHNADPMRFYYNDVWVDPTGTPTRALLYFNCTPTCCGTGCTPSQELTLLSEVDTELTTNGQTTQVQGNNLNADPDSCLLDPAGRGGDYQPEPLSACADLGLERNGSCNICQTPWVDRFGTHRLDWENRLSNGGANCPVVDCTVLPTPASCVAMSGDDIPDIGPAEL